jgi:hypothetical protein
MHQKHLVQWQKISAARYFGQFRFPTKCNWLFPRVACKNWRVVLQNPAVSQFAGQFLSLSENFDLNANDQKGRYAKT